MGVEDQVEAGPSGNSALLAAAAALVASVAIPGQPFGVNVAITGTLVLVAVWAATHRSIDWPYGLFAGLALVLMSLPAIRSATWLVVLDLLGALFITSVGVSRARGWAEVSISLPRVIGNVPKGTAHVVRPFARRATLFFPDLGLGVRAALLSGVLLLIFGSLFASADPAFASLAEQVLVPDWDLSSALSRVIVAVGALVLTGSITLLAPEFGPSPTLAVSMWRGEHLQPQLSATEWKPALLLIDLLFASFVLVQIAVLFGGHDHVLNTAGLTYAEYARQGFFQLTVVALLTLAVVTAAVRFSRVEVSDRGWMKILLGLLCLFTLVILASALTRMNLYQETYGFTRLRLTVDLTIVWLGAVFVMLLAAGIKWEGKWLPRAVVILSAVTLIGFNIYNPDARIGERNVDRYFRTGKIDVGYLAGLSPDAVPQLIRLREPLRSCALGRMESRLAKDSFWSWNLARQDARRLLASPAQRSPGWAHSCP
jgi:Domain of unknown function (DUF4173)